MLDVLADNFVIFDYGIFPLTDFEQAPLEHCNTLFASHLAPFDVKLGSIWLSRILKCKKEIDERLP